MQAPPHDIEAERSVLGAMLVSESALSIVAEKLHRNDFYSETHRNLYDAAMALYAEGEPVDGMTIAAELTGPWAADKGYVLKLLEAFPTAANAHQYAQIVKDRAILRSLIDASDRIKVDAYEAHGDSEGAIERSEHELYRLSTGLEQDRRSSLSSLSGLAGDQLSKIQELYEAGGLISGLSTGYPDLDLQLGGCHPGDLIMLGARPAMGKTSLALGAAMNIADQGLAVPFFSLEMTKEQLVQRLISMRADVPLNHIRSGRVTDAEWPRLVQATAEVDSLPIYIDETSDISVPAMRSRLRRLHSRLRGKQQIGMIMVDYLGLISSHSRTSKNRNDEVAAISRSLKILAKDFGVPVMAVAQLSRTCEQRGDKRPTLSDLRDSGAQEQDADVVMFLYRDEYYNPDSESKGLAEAIIAKHRNGPTGKVELAWFARCAKFGSLAHQREEISA